MLESLYRQHRQGLFTLALAVTRRPDLAEDAIQEAFVRMFARPADQKDPVAYVFGAVRNAAVDQLRRQGRCTDVVQASLFNGHVPGPAGVEEPPARLARAELDECVRQAVDGLSNAQREAVVLKIYGGLTFAQIAEVLGEPMPTVASRYRRALDTLHEQVGRML